MKMGKILVLLLVVIFLSRLLPTVSFVQADINPMETGVVIVSSDHITVNLDNTYINPVVICSIQYNNNDLPVVPRVSNVTSTSFQVRLQNPSSNTVMAERVSYLVVEEGAWIIDGVKLKPRDTCPRSPMRIVIGWVSPKATCRAIATRWWSAK